MKIAVQNLSFTYAEHKVLTEISLTVESGNFFGIIGPNGSGKTTLLKLLSRVLRPESGLVKLGERALDSYSQNDLAKVMAVVVQDTFAGYLFSVEEIVMMGRTPYLGRFQAETLQDYALVRQALELTGCLELRQRKIAELSGGERQRVMIARALAQQPKVLILDEPTAHLDIGYQQEILDLVKRLCLTEGLTVVTVLHDLNLAAYYCNELVLLEQGRIAAAGSPADVLTAENIARVYKTAVLISPHPLLGTPTVALLPSKRASLPQQKKSRIHLLAGGGSAGELMRDLREAGYILSVGVLNVGDSDWEAARSLNLPLVAEAPFSAITAEQHTQNLRLIQQANVVVLAEIPIGHGNLLNLRAALTALAEGKAVYLLEENVKQQRDFTQGEGQELLAEIKQGGAVIITEKARLYRALAETL
ncbi:MAG: heme ABC transporter ATP-binding protein [Dethiobacter sp.]|jgi:iron complex transport system ATP-binding protein|nr:heme ABC transporter ATP-binding protein [Dethiobacter sp.]MBS3900534.1 heme ABC transporter ATP-binding protein [Dethiobacter sp.]MBS3989360.1 heme ABC transporter ATP-binding protein [Dethiobacter sp.]